MRSGPGSSIFEPSFINLFFEFNQLGFAYPHFAIEYKLSEVASLPRARSIIERLGIEIFAQKQYNESILLQDRNLAGGTRFRNCQWVEL